MPILFTKKPLGVVLCTGSETDRGIIMAVMANPCHLRPRRDDLANERWLETCAMERMRGRDSFQYANLMQVLVELGCAELAAGRIAHRLLERTRNQGKIVGTGARNVRTWRWVR
jgi:hypothetical protein